MNNVGRAALDTNIVVYAFSSDRRFERAEQLLREKHEISVQTLNEFVNVARRKMNFAADELEEALADIVTLCRQIHPVTFESHRAAMVLGQRYDLSIYDANIVAVALLAGCDTLYSEDMHDGLVIDDRLTIRNPFAGD